MMPTTMKKAFDQSFDLTWPSNPNRRRCPACDNWTLFLQKHPIKVWKCAHMEGADYCGYSELVDDES